ncbi:MAG: NAD-glutamate dehydrogenase [Rhodospirillales bacterium]|nr:NAD-glutamate dehydrogenase [Rhodospirillales bacterium]
MPQSTESHRNDLINKATECATRRLGEAEAAVVAEFVRRYYAHVPPYDLRGESPDAIFGAAFSHFRLGARRKPGEDIVRVYNPRLDEHGWRCEHTVVEVVTDDMPFLVDSVTARLNQEALTVHLVIHPIFTVRRDNQGVFNGLAANGADGALAESFMRIEVTHQSGDILETIAGRIRRVLKDVRSAVSDWEPMRERLKESTETLEANAPAWPAEAVAEIREFLEWLYKEHFTLLGYREYRIEGGGDAPKISIVEGSGLGILRDPAVFVFDEAVDASVLPRALRMFVVERQLLVLTKTDLRSTVHRTVPMDAIGIKLFDAEGRVVGHRMFVGLFTSSAYTQSPMAIPLLRSRVKKAIERAGFEPRSHDGKALLNILETFPRDELFQVDYEHLYRTAVGIHNLQDRQKAALFIRRDDYERYVTCLVYVPSDRYNTQLRLTIQTILERAFNGEVMSQYSEVGDSPLARLYMIIRTVTGQIPEYEASELEAQIVDATRTWSDLLKGSLIAAHGEEEGHILFQRYCDAFPPGYQAEFNADEAVADIERIEILMVTHEIEMTLYRPFEVAEHRMRFKVYRPKQPIILSEVLPMLEHLGLRVIDEIPYAVPIPNSDVRLVMIHDFGLETRSGQPIDMAAIRDSFKQAFLNVWCGNAESDRFNSLVLEARMSAREVTVIRAYSRYLRQAGIAFSQSYMQDALLNNASLARLTVDLFKTMFDPAIETGREQKVEAVAKALNAGLENVESADEDRILRRFFNAVQSTLRTNYFQRGADGAPKPYLSFKIDSRAVAELPLPRPMVEVFVYSPRMEGIHLRGGKVARGGIRWSDRREDFRTEILGLMKAQMVKNVVIVPVGSKGGFIVKRPPATGDREAIQAEGIECYKSLIRGILDLTDNRVGGQVVPPEDVVRRDDDDPYLVVAADKGTATFSDIANGVSKEYGFWLDDAFASGGSQGYDHKAMGITARGAWESVKRHFREMGKDIQAEPFTVVGVGDMSGDVFGNGMLLSPCIKLLGAFNHLHIFVDPDPDPAVSLKERQRLFALPRSSWSDYDHNLISQGGGIFDRRAKTLNVSPEIRERFGLGSDHVRPNDLIRAMLRAEVELMWFGGIGTYVKASYESDTDAGDRSNDAVRIDGRELRCQVVGEGANLAFTQNGRIEYALAGGRINTDFIDNSAGVDCSDHEVNIKILLGSAVRDGDMTEKQRNRLLAEMTDEVAALVLRDNYLQSQAITLIKDEGFSALENQTRLMRMFERQGRLDREVEFLPEDDALAERIAARQGLTRPEIAVLFAYCKLWLYDKVLESDLPDDRHLAEDVVRYFPTPIQNGQRERIRGHILRRELIATSITNSLINRVGGTFVTEISDKSGMPAVDVARAYIITRDVFGLRDVWVQIEALDNLVPADAQSTLHRDAQRLIERGTMWFLRNGGSPIDITRNVGAYKQPVAALATCIDSVLPEEMNGRILHRVGRYTERGVPENLARQIAYLIAMPSACDIVRIAAARGIAVEDVARLNFALGESLGLGWLRYQAEKISAMSHWQKLAVSAIIEELYNHQCALTVHVLDTVGKAGDGAISAWTENRAAAVERVRVLLGELEASGPLDLSMLTVASRQVGTLVAA